jgi:uncharacterized protein
MRSVPASFWNIYEALVDPIPAKIAVISVSQGRRWTYVEAETGVGMALSDTSGSCLGYENSENISLRELASWIRSWDFSKASIGLAAVNAFWNQPSACDRNFAPTSRIERDSLSDWVSMVYAGKSVLTVGHFSFVDKLAESCKLQILERNPGPGDLPDTACEVLLPSQDLVLITAATLVNKSFVRLSQLVQGDAILLGPSTPLCPEFCSHGMTQLSGLLVRDSESLMRHIRTGASREVFKGSLTKPMAVRL